MANEQEEAGFNPAFLLSSRPADFVRKPPSARLMSQFEFLLPTPLQKFGSEFSGVDPLLTNRDTPDLATSQ
jgi:hypothetical protein